MFPFKSSILHEKAQLQELNHRLESYLSRVRQLEQVNQSLVAEIQHLRSETRTEERNAYVDEINKMRWELEELMFEKSKAEMQRSNLWQEIQELQEHHTTEQTVLKNISQQLAEHEKALQETETTNGSLEAYIFELRAECQTLEDRHVRARREMREKLRRAPQLLVSQGYHAAPVTGEDFEHHALAISTMWEENFAIYKSKIEELETAVQLDKERGEELNEERALLIREIEALKKELEDQFNLQNQLEEDFLTFQQKHDMDMEEYQRAIDLLEDEKQHLMSAITFNLNEQQQLMQVKMGLSLELSTYRALLGEHTKHQGIEQHLRKPRQGTDTRSHSYSVVVRPAHDTLDRKKWKPTSINIPSSFRRDTVMIKKGTTPEPVPSTVPARKTINSSLSDEDLLYTDDTSSLSTQNVASSAKSINAHGDAARFIPTASALHSTMKDAAVPQQGFPEKIDRKSKVIVPGAEYVAEVATHKSRIVVKESDSDDKRDVSYNFKSRSPNESPQSSSEVQDYDFNRRSTEPTDEEEYEREPSKDVITVRSAPKDLEVKVDLSNVGPPITPDRYICEASTELTKYFHSDNIIEKNKEVPTMGAVEEILTKTNTEESNDNQGTVISKEEKILTNDIRIGDIIKTVIKPTDLEKMKASPEPVITYQIEEEEMLDDGTIKREIIIQSRREETVDVADESTLEEMLNMDAKSSELQLKGALEHLTESRSENLIDGPLSLHKKGRQAPGKVSVSVEMGEQTSEQSGETDDFSMPADMIPLSLGAEESDYEGKDGTYEEVLNVTMTAADFRKTMLSNTEPLLQKFTESSSSFSPSNEKARETLHETETKLHCLQGDEDTETVKQTKFTLQDSLSKELSAPCIIEESIKVPQGVQASIVELLNEETEDPKLKLKGALQQLQGAVPESLRDELSVLTRDAQEGSDNVSINIKNVQQSSHRGVVTIEAEVNVSQSLDPEDFYLMGEYIGDEENKDEIGSGLKFLNTQEKIQELLGGKGLKTVDTLHDEEGINARVSGINEQLMSLSETSARSVEDTEYTSSQDLTGGPAIHEMTKSSEMEGDLSKQSTWFQKATGEMDGEEFLHRTSDPVDPSETFHMDINRMMSIRTTGGDSGEGMTLITQQQEIAEGTDGRRLVGHMGWYEEWESGSSGVNEVGVTDAVEEEDLQASDPELMQYAASSKVLTKARIIASEGITQVARSEQKVIVTYVDESQSDDLPQSADEL
ncbi:synemin [Carcharodon carcharias]|uniref:synemin n=1 Tax=Carcharodon carcharias TaxID=13397 RepID=UPI001B7DA878|nr:synemin [Carcharodon carcharias]